MTTITEDYVSFEIAKLLKKKGFDEKCEFFHKDPQSWIYQFKNGIPKSYSDNPIEPCFLAPTLQMAMKWLREVQNLFVFPFPQVDTNKFWAEIYQLSDNQEWENLYCESIDLQDYSTYEEACEAAIKYCLENLI